MDVLDISRWQFGVTTVYHFMFVPLTIGLAPLVAIMQTLWFVTGKTGWYRATKFFGKLLLINFAIGVATGIVQEFQFGMNWSEYSRFVGDVFGAPLAMEGLAAFFLESTFLGLWIFGWKLLPRWLHLTCIWLFAIGTNLSAYFIIAANSFMQHPVGAEYNPVTNRVELKSIFALLTNSTTLAAFPHVIAGALLTGGTFIAGVAGWWMVRSQRQADALDAVAVSGAALLPGTVADDAAVEAGPTRRRGRLPLLLESDLEDNPAARASDKRTQARDVFRPAFRLGLWVMLVAGLALVITGDMQGKLMFEQQPQKMASAESLCQTAVDPDFSLLTIGSRNDCSGVDHVLEVPKVLSYLAKGKFSGVELQGSENLQAQYEQQFGSGDYTPNLFVTYWSFRAMIGLGIGSAALALVGLWVTRKKRVPTSKRFGQLSLLAIPFPFLANSAGWIFTEMGRQPWVIHPNPAGDPAIRLTVADAVSGNPLWMVLTTLIGFTLVYGVLAVVWYGLMRRYAIEGPLEHDSEPPALDDGDEDDSQPRPLAFAY